MEASGANETTNMQNYSTDVDMEDVGDIELDINDPEVWRQMQEEEREWKEAEELERQRALQHPFERLNDPRPAPMSQLTDTVPRKVHIMGLNTLSTQDVQAFIAERGCTRDFLRVEWINDSSANLEFVTDEAAKMALNAFTGLNVEDWEEKKVPKTGLSTKELSYRPDVELRVRLAGIYDAKQKGARKHSEWYQKNGRRDSRSDDRGRFKKPRDLDAPRKSRHGEGEFDVSLYGEDTSGSSREPSRHRDAGSRDRRHNSFPGTRDIELFGDASSRKKVQFSREDNRGRLRNRSASPNPEGDGRMGFEADEEASRRKIRRRTPTPPSYRKDARTTRGKELFPVKLVTFTTDRELFGKKSPSAPRSKELFPNRTPNSNHRRSDAVDASEDVPELFQKAPVKARSLADRITRGPPSLEDRITKPRDLASRITNNGKSDQKGQAEGFTIRGAAQETRELFEDRELFDTKNKGRGGPRRGAEDFF
ncbi:uncharacterized protein BDZ99DRAFT_463318 [Mytilinidion resinicola]|uniref:Uncharacterized protein n=1 Tax=Mytilinidion resinicola TaxID=574789 RepID=A0A6A6YNU7_9PEZI|nr:uncharacterized protein BDZ99DRAFT_463318 [Mytilinidion resinicola]KAF2809537.1 hypothetical protein BDZ99DRAFT_463318 [Mytilinidion resinicola]